MGKNTFNLQISGTTKTASIEVIEDIKFTAHFERTISYKGNFGFDWMRDNYQKILDKNKYDEIKNNYKDAKIHGLEYFVPYLSMFPELSIFPEQGNVILNLKIDNLIGKPKKDDVIKLPQTDGVKFVPDEVSIKDLENEQNKLAKEQAKGYGGNISTIKRTEVRVICEKSLTKDTSIQLLDKNDIPVGEIILVKNNEVNIVKVKFIKVMSNEPIEEDYRKITFNNVSEEWVKDTCDILNSKYFNQSLIKVENDGLEEFKIDVKSYLSKGLLILPEGIKIPRYNSGFDKELYKEYVERYKEEYGGVIFFLSSFQQPDRKLGHAKLYPTELNYILMSPSSVGSLDRHSYAHELGHTLGLDHPWATEEEYTKRLYEINSSLSDLDKFLDRNDGLPDGTPIRGSTITLGEKKVILEKRFEQLDIEKCSREKFILKHPFDFDEEGTTENVMDYGNGISFWKWQWDIMINEVKQYHGK